MKWRRAGDIFDYSSDEQANCQHQHCPEQEGTE